MSRYRFVLIEESAGLPVPYRAPRRQSPRPPRRDIDPMLALLDAFSTIGRRGPGAEGFGAPLSANPLSFLLDALGEPVLLRDAEGRVLYRNRAAEDIDEPPPRPPVAVETVRVGPRSYRRRCMLFERGGDRVVLEVLTESQENHR